MAIIQAELLSNEDVIDTVFRPSKKNPLVTNGIIDTTTGTFNGHKALMSKFNRKTFTGKCANCHEMCGVKMSNNNYEYPDRPGILEQLKIFKK